MDKNIVACHFIDGKLAKKKFVENTNYGNKKIQKMIKQYSAKKKLLSISRAETCRNFPKAQSFIFIDEQGRLHEFTMMHWNNGKISGKMNHSGNETLL